MEEMQEMVDEPYAIQDGYFNSDFVIKRKSQIHDFFIDGFGGNDQIVVGFDLKLSYLLYANENVVSGHLFFLHFITGNGPVLIGQGDFNVTDGTSLFVGGVVGHKRLDFLMKKGLH